MAAAVGPRRALEPRPGLQPVPAQHITSMCTPTTTSDTTREFGARTWRQPAAHGSELGWWRRELRREFRRLDLVHDQAPGHGEEGSDSSTRRVASRGARGTSTSTSPPARTATSSARISPSGIPPGIKHRLFRTIPCVGSDPHARHVRISVTTGLPPHSSTPEVRMTRTQTPRKTSRSPSGIEGIRGVRKVSSRRTQRSASAMRSPGTRRATR